MKGTFAFAAAILLLGPSAVAQVTAPDGGAPQTSSSVTEATLRAVKDHRVTLVTAQGELTGKVLAAEPDSITIARDDGEVVTVPRSLITHIRLADASPPPPPPVLVQTQTALARPSTSEMPPPAAETTAARTSGLAISVTAAAGIAVDGDYGHFHAFASTAFVFPLVASGQLFAGTAGAGATFSLSPKWRVDLFAHVAPMYFPGGNYGTSFYVGMGVGFGFRYLSPSGWCIGIKLPFLGGAVGSYPLYNNNVGVVTGYYYLASAISLPVFSVGYRF